MKVEAIECDSCKIKQKNINVIKNRQSCNNDIFQQRLHKEHLFE